MVVSTRRRFISSTVRTLFLCAVYFSYCILHAVASSINENNAKASITINDSSLNSRKLPVNTAIRRNLRNVDLQTEDDTRDNAPQSQNFFQSFAPLFANPAPIAHSRPLVYPDHAFKPSFKTATYRDLPFTGANDNILGSGNFGVVKGGTYYAEDRDDDADGDLGSESEPYAYIGSAAQHSRVHRKKNPPPAFRNGGDFFAHFRDFADITAPKSAFSQYYLVYVRPDRNGTHGSDAGDGPIVAETRKHPRNIIEQLAMLDDAANDETTSTSPSELKQSKFKRKLQSYRNADARKEREAKSKLFTPPKEMPEPLLALS